MGLLSEFMDRGTMEDKLHLQDRCEQQDDKKKGKFVVPLEQSHTASEQLYSISPLTPVEKLEYALDMAQALALLHNNEFGVIVHDDLKLDQFLIAQPSSSPASTTTHGRRSSGPRVKLNDFNRGEAMMYDYQHGEYCKYRNGRGRGPVRCILWIESALLCWLCVRVCMFRQELSHLAFLFRFSGAIARRVF